MEENRMTATSFLYQKINDVLPPNGRVYCWGLNLNRNEFVALLVGVFTSSNIKEVRFLGFGYEASIEYRDNKLIYSNKDVVKEVEVGEYYFDGATFSKS